MYEFILKEAGNRTFHLKFYANNAAPVLHKGETVLLASATQVRLRADVMFKGKAHCI